MDLSQTLNGQREEKQCKFVLFSVVHCFHKRPHLRCSLLALHVISKMKIYIFHHFVKVLDAILAHQTCRGFIEVFSSVKL